MPTDKYWLKGNIGSKQVFQVMVIKKRRGELFSEHFFFDAMAKFEVSFFYAFPVDEILYLSSRARRFFFFPSRGNFLPL